MEEKNLEDYTLREIYMNFPTFEEKYDGIINHTYTLHGAEENDFYSKLKFIKLLNQYKKQIEVMPYIDRFSDAIIGRIFDNINSIKTVSNNNENVQYNKENQEFVFNCNAYENIALYELIEPLTKIALTSSIPENDISKGFQISRAEYIAKKIKQAQQGNPNLDFTQPTPASIAYQRLIDILGEENVLLLSKNTVKDIAKRLNNTKMHQKNIEFFENTLSKNIFEFFNIINDDNISDKEKWDELEFFNEGLKDYEKSIEFFNEPATQEADNSKNMFSNLLWRTLEIPDKLKTQMLENLEINAKDIIEKDLDGKYNGLFCDNKQILLDINGNKDENIKQKTLIHELIHASTLKRDNIGRTIRIGLRNPRTGEGTGLNEGLTEYFAHEIYKQTQKPDVYKAYSEIISICKDLFTLYGKETLIDAMINGTDNLENLMQQDGKSYSELRELVDNCYGIVHKDEKPWWEAMKYPEAKEAYYKIGEYIESIKEVRGMQNEESEWKKTYDSTFCIFVSLPNKKETWFDKLKNKFKFLFGFGKDKKILLSEQNKIFVNNHKKNDEFIDGIKVSPGILETIKKHETQEKMNKKEETENIR